MANLENFALDSQNVSPQSVKYSGNDNRGQPKSLYLEKLQRSTDSELFETTKSMIWLSAYAANNSRSDYHWMCDATYDEWVRRGKVSEYGNAHSQVMAENGY